MADFVLINTRSKIRTLAERWRNIYPYRYTLRDGRKSDAIAVQLEALDPETATVEDVTAILGDPGWVQGQWCIACDTRDNEAVVEVGEYEAEGEVFEDVTLCKSCVEKALAAFKGV